MKANQIHRQVHGYRSGHQLLQSSVRLSPKDQDVVDHLSDAAGQLRPGESFGAYLTAYPLPSREFYAFARTEQDQEAARSGCVRTETLLIPMEYWAQESPSVFTTELSEDSIDGVLKIRSTRAPILEPVDDPGMSELVEALFVDEKDRAIVIFGASNAEGIALRLLTAFWPKMRRRFSVCTLALSPRMLSGRSFDLLFAPPSARLRFSDWQGVRIEIGAGRTEHRHRWTAILTHRIFRSEVPFLADDDSLRDLVVRECEKNRSTLRLSLLWEDLHERVQRSPTAVLGLIDIAKSRVVGGRTWDVLERVVAQSVATAVGSLGLDAAWDFLNTLLEKLEDEGSAETVNEAIRTAGIELTQRDWRSGIRYLGAESGIHSRYAEELVRAVALTVARTESLEICRALVAMCPDRMVKVALLEDSMLGRLFSATDPDVDAALIGNIVRGFGSLTPEERRRYMGHFLPHIRGDQDIGLLAAILSDARGRELVAAVNVIWRDSKLRTRSVGEVLCAAANVSDNRRQIRTEFANIGVDEQTVRCIGLLLSPDPEDVRWVLENVAIGARRPLFLTELIETSSALDLERAFGGKDIASRALHILVGDLGRCASSAARVVRLPGISAIDHVRVGLEILPMVVGSERGELANSLVVRVLNDTAVGDEDFVERVVARLIADVDLTAVLNASLGVALNGERVSRSLVVLHKIESTNHGVMGGHVRNVVQLLARRSEFDLSKDGADALSMIVEGSQGFARDTYVEICSTVLPFAMRGRSEPASHIVTVAFPVLYEELRNGGNGVWLGSLFKFLTGIDAK